MENDKSTAGESQGTEDPEDTHVVNTTEAGSYARQTFGGRGYIAFIWEGDEYDKEDAWISAFKDDLVDIEDSE